MRITYYQNNHKAKCILQLEPFFIDMPSNCICFKKKNSAIYFFYLFKKFFEKQLSQFENLISFISYS